MDKSIEEIIIEKLLSRYPIEEEVAFDEFNLQEKLRMNAFLILKYSHLLTKEKLSLEQEENNLARVMGERYHYYRFEFDEQLTKTEIEKYYLPRDKNVNEAKEKIQRQKIIVGFFETAVQSLTSQGWNMKHFGEDLRRGY